jgi:hypothetical protein
MHKYKHCHFEGLEKLWVIAVVSNPQRYCSRYKLFNEFKNRTLRAGANLFIVETALGDRPFEVTTGAENELQLRTTHELWHKERMINLGVERLPRDWQYVAWVDADVTFAREDWVEETVHQLQHYDVVQMFHNALDMGPEGQVLNIVEGFMSCFINGKPRPQFNEYYYASGHPEWHPGYAWAARREAFDKLGGLIDTAIVGAADRHMAWGMLGVVDGSIPTNASAGYRDKIANWTERANTHVRQNVGYVPGALFHHWHGKKRDRRYHDRWQIIVNHQFEPEKDLRRDWQGLWAFTNDGLRMRNDIRGYFQSRNEDSIDVE